jgi:hypothetical protein
MLDDDEWAQIAPLLQRSVQVLKSVRERTGADLHEAQSGTAWRSEVIRLHLELTGQFIADPLELWHHRLSDRGPPCPVCGRLARTPRAKLCPECGGKVESRKA